MHQFAPCSVYILISEALEKSFTRQTYAKRKDVTMNNTNTTAVDTTAKTEKKIAHMESIADAAKMFRLPKNLVRTMALSGKIKSYRVSNSRNAKIFVNVDSLNDLLNTNTLCDEPEEETKVNGIEPIPLHL